MKKIVFSIFVLPLTIIIAVASNTIVIGCAGYSITGGPGKTAPPNLQSKVGASSQLVSINSLLVSKIALDERVNTQVNKVDFDSELKNILQEELDLKLQYSGLSSITNRLDLIKHAQKQNLDGVLITQVHNFVERTGSKVGSDQAAAVDFSMSVVRVSDGATLWESSYHYKDQALSDNLFKLGQKLSDKQQAGWKSAQALLVGGYRSAVSDFAKRRVSQFSKGG